MSPGDTPPSFGRYQLMQVVREDGATTLHDAFDPELGHQVALITSPGGTDTAAEDRLAFRLRRMRHPNVVSVLDMGRQDDVLFVAAEHLATEPLATFLARARPIPFLQGLPLLLQLLSAIEHAQARGMAHATIDLEHVQVTPGGQVKLPAGGWSLSTDRQPNLQAAAGMARVLLAGTCAAHVRRALDDVLRRAEAADPAARYPRADDFILALLEATGYPVRRRAQVERPLVAEPRPAGIAPRSRPGAEHALARTPRRPLARSRPGRSFVAAASLLAALLVPQLVGNGILTDRHDPPVPTATLPMGAAPEAAAPPAAAVPTVAATPVETPPVPVSPPAPAPAAASVEPPVAVAKAPVAAPHPRAARTAAPHRAAPASPPRTAARQVAAVRPAVTRTRAPRPQAAAPTPAAGCPFDIPMLRDLCMAQQCNRAEMRQAPSCVRMLAEQRAALARLRGTPD